MTVTGRVLREGEEEDLPVPGARVRVFRRHGVSAEAPWLWDLGDLTVDLRAVEERLAEIDTLESGAMLRQSALGRMGQGVEPVVEPLGWDWRVSSAVIASFPAREVVVAVLGTVYAVGDDADEATLLKLLAAAPDGAEYRYIAVWKMPNLGHVHMLETAVQKDGWGNYFEIVNARGKVSAMDTFVGDMVRV